MGPGVDFAIHWNDGPTTAGCPLECSGFLEVYYAEGNETLFASMRYEGDQFGLVRHPDERLELLHQGMLEAISPILQMSGVNRSQIPAPELVAVGVWESDADGINTSPRQVVYDTQVHSLGEACGVTRLSTHEYQRTALQPWGNAQVYLANGDWQAIEKKEFYGDWAETSLLMAERALHRLGFEPPKWLDDSYYQEKIFGQ